MPRHAGRLTEGRGDRAVRKGTKLDDLDLRAGVEHDNGLIEERECGVGETAGADRVALTYDEPRRDRCVRAASAAHVDVALEDRDVGPCLDRARGRAEDHRRSGREQQQRRERSGDEKQWPEGTLPRCDPVDDWQRHGLRSRGDEAACDRRRDLAGARGHDGDRNIAEENTHVVRRLVVERIGHRKRRFAATEAN